MSDNTIDRFTTLAREHFKLYLSIGLSVFLFILFFQPFEVEVFDFENILLFYTGFGFIVFIFLIVLLAVFQSLFALDRDAQVENSILIYFYHFSLFASTSLAFLFYLRYVGQVPITFILTIKAILICMSCAVVLYFRRTYSQTQSRYRNLLIENKVLHNKLNQLSDTFSSKYVELISENISDNFRIQLSSIVFLKSADNYVEVSYLEGEELRKKLLRTTLKNLEQQLKEYGIFIRTHRTCIVNAQYIERIQKKLNSIWLILSETKELIPVSRQYLMSVKDML